MKEGSMDLKKIDDLKNRISFGIKFWLKFKNGEPKNILGAGWAKLLESIANTENDALKSLTKAAKECNYSYKYAWNILKRIERRTGMSPVITGKGGPGGGGYVKLSEWGKYLLKTYKRIEPELIKLEKKLKILLNLEH